VQNSNQDRFKNILVIVVGFSAISYFVAYKWPEQAKLSEWLLKGALIVGIVSLISSTVAK
jgi:uncharacterized membrane protein YccC